MNITVVDVALACLVAVAVTVAVMSPRLRQFAGAVAVAAGFFFLGRKLSRHGDEDDTPAIPPPRVRPDPIPDPSTDLRIEIQDAHDDVDLIPPAGIDDAVAEYERRTRGGS